MKMPWFRFYSEFLDDTKVGTMSESDQLLWVKLLCMASESKKRGRILETDEQICWRIRISPETLRHALDKFRAKGMIEHCDGGYRITHWDERQHESDNSTPRVRKYREKKRTETEEKRFSNASETPPEKDTEKETDLDPDPDLEREDLNPNQHAYACTPPVTVEGEKISWEEESEPNKSSETVRPVENQEVNASQQSAAKDMGSAAAVLKVSKPKIDYERFREVYNAEKPPLWAEMQVVNEKRQKIFRQLAKDCGGQENALVALVNALTFARADTWCRTRDLSFENFATNGKIIQFHERQTTLQVSGLPAMTPGLQKSFEVRSQVARALDRFRTPGGAA